MKRINRIYPFVLFLCLLFAATSAFAASEAEYNKLEKTYKLNEDGSQEYRCAMELTLFTHTAMNGTYGESFIVYNPDYQELQIHYSYTVQKDGKIIETPKNAFVEVLPANAADAPAYNNLKEMVVVHTGLELGATIYLDYSIITKPGYLPALDVYDEPLQSSPVQELIYSVIVPESTPFTYTLQNNSAKPKTIHANGMTTTSWTLRNLPAASRNMFVSAKYGDVPYFTATTFASCKEALSTLHKQFNPLKDAQIAAVAENITEDKDTDTEKVQAILNYINNNLGNSRLSLSETGFRFRPADAVINTAYGTAAEKVNLLNGMLNAVGVQAEPAALYRVNADKGCGLNAIAELFVVAKADGKQFLLSPLSENRMATAGALNNLVPSVSLATGEKLTFETPDVAIDYQVDMTVSPEKADAQITSRTGTAQRPYFSEDKGSSTSSQALKATDGYVLVNLPDAPMTLANSHFCRMNSDRKDNLMMPCKADEQYNYSIQIPEGMKLCTPQIDKTIANAAGQLVYSVQKNGNTAHVTRSLKLNKQLYTPAEYAALRALLTEWGNADMKVLLFAIQ
jgi:Domain of Unknown Function with PDB structure (DUF3857)/Domain of Unknown Function with PDB structure (DUF3858)/Transglutaminase-like superfamily